MIALRVVGWAAAALAWTAAALVGLGILLGVAFAMCFPWVMRRIKQAGGVAPEDAANVGTSAQVPTVSHTETRDGWRINYATTANASRPLTPEPTDKIALATRIRDAAQAEIDRLNREGLRRVTKVWAPGSLN